MKRNRSVLVLTSSVPRKALRNITASLRCQPTPRAPTTNRAHVPLGPFYFLSPTRRIDAPRLASNRAVRSDRTASRCLFAEHGGSPGKNSGSMLPCQNVNTTLKVKAKIEEEWNCVNVDTGKYEFLVLNRNGHCHRNSPWGNTARNKRCRINCHITIRHLLSPYSCWYLNCIINSDWRSKVNMGLHLRYTAVQGVLIYLQNTQAQILNVATL